MPNEDPEWKGRMEVKMDFQTTLLEKLDHTINGNGKPGLRIDVDRLKQTASRHAKVGMLVATVVVGLLVKAFWTILFR